MRLICHSNPPPPPNNNLPLFLEKKKDNTFLSYQFQLIIQTGIYFYPSLQHSSFPTKKCMQRYNYLIVIIVQVIQIQNTNFAFHPMKHFLHCFNLLRTGILVFKVCRIFSSPFCRFREIASYHQIFYCRRSMEDEIEVPWLHLILSQ